MQCRARRWHDDTMIFRTSDDNLQGFRSDTSSCLAWRQPALPPRPQHPQVTPDVSTCAEFRVQMTVCCPWLESAEQTRHPCRSEQLQGRPACGMACKNLHDLATGGLVKNRLRDLQRYGLNFATWCPTHHIHAIVSLDPARMAWPSILC